MLPLSLLSAAQASPVVIELKNGNLVITIGETYNGHLVNCDSWMNIILTEVICTSSDGSRFWRIPEIYIRGNTIKHLRITEPVLEKVQQEQVKQQIKGSKGKHSDRGRNKGGKNYRGGKSGDRRTGKPNKT